MVNPKNARNKKEHFNFFEDIINDATKLAITIGIIIVIIIAIFFFMQHNKSQDGAGIMNFVSDTSPMAPLTATPAM